MELRNKLTAFLQNITSFFKSPSHNRTLVIIGILIVAAIMPVTVIVLQQQTNTQQHAYQQCDPITTTQCGGSSPVSCSTKYSSDQLVTATQNAGQRCGNTVCSSQGRVPGRCGVPAACRAVGQQCGVNSDCCGGYSGGTTYCSRKGTCTKYCTTTLGHDCVNDYYCSAYFNYHGICASTSTFDCKQVDGKCGYVAPKLINTGIVCGGNHNGACYIYNIVKATSVTCPSGTKAEYTTTSDTSGTACGGVHHPIAKTAVSCCVPVSAPNPYAGCTDFNASQIPNDSTGKKTDTACQNAAKTTYRKDCNYPQYYKFVPGKTALDAPMCVFNKPAGEPPTPSPLPSCSSKGGGTCYQNNSCGTGMHVIDGVTCPTGTRICCVPNTGTTNYCQYANSGDGGYCGSVLGHGANTNHLYTCKSKQTTGDTACANGCHINSSGSDTCNTSGGGGGGGGGGPTATPTPPACTNGKTTIFAVEMKLPGIGTGKFENKSLKHATRQTTVTVKDSNGNTIWTQGKFATKLSFTSAMKLRVGQIKLTAGLSCGKTYYVYIKVPGYLTIKKQVVYGTTQTIQIAESDITPGDIVSAGTDNFLTADGTLGGDDKVTVADYNLLRSCHNVDPNTTQSFKSGSTTIKVKCGDAMNLFDYADGGTKGDEWAFNYNLWLRGFLKANGL